MISRAFLMIMTLFFLNNTTQCSSQTAKGDGFENNQRNALAVLYDIFESKLKEYLYFFTRKLEKLNDKHLSNTVLGSLLPNDELKPRLELEASGATKHEESRKKKDMSMMPLLFHMGASSTWMVLTSVMVAKSVLIGLMLLVFKIAVVSAKLASFFTLMKGKSDHGSWTWSHPSHHEYHEVFPVHSSSEGHSYSPSWSPMTQDSNYHTLPSNHMGPYRREDAYAHLEERKKDGRKKF